MRVWNECNMCIVCSVHIVWVTLCGSGSVCHISLRGVFKWMCMWSGDCVSVHGRCCWKIQSDFLMFSPD